MGLIDRARSRMAHIPARASRDPEFVSRGRFMTQDQDAGGPPPPKAGSRVVTLGVVGACALGALLGFWARPDSIEQGRAPPRSPAAAPDPERRLQIVLDDAPPPQGRPLDVLPAAAPAAPEREIQMDTGPEPPAPSDAAPEPAAPVQPTLAPRPPVGLMKVAAAAAPAVAGLEARATALGRAGAGRWHAEAARAERFAADASAHEASEARRAELRKAKQAAAAEQAKADLRAAQAAKAERLASARAKAEKARRAEAQLARAEKLRLQKARAEAARAEAVALAAEKRRAGRLKAEKARELAAEDSSKVNRLAAMVRTLQARVAAADRRAKTEQLAAADAQRHAAKPRPAKGHERPELARAAPPHPKPARGEGPLRLARNTCVSSDPGEAMVCADPRLSVRERQLQRAFREAQAAGVPAAELQRQQQRWLQARAAAAREAPWAVEEAYEARIAELNDQSRSGGGN